MSEMSDTQDQVDGGFADAIGGEVGILAPSIFPVDDEANAAGLPQDPFEVPVFDAPETTTEEGVQ